jgi:apolipoprotein N-acyltransferase
MRRRFVAAFLWYAAVQAVQLSWMTSFEYQGVYILFVYAALTLWLGAQFAVLTWLLPRLHAPFPFRRALEMAALWTLMEWARLHVLCGFSWNPAGLALASYAAPMQCAALFGVLGLSFWVILVNACALKWRAFGGGRRTLAGVLALAAAPYLLGWAQIAYRAPLLAASPTLRVGLVQTALLPSEKTPLSGHRQAFLPPFQQWMRIVQFLKKEGKETLDLIVLPESVVPLLSSLPVYPADAVQRALIYVFGPRVASHLPPLVPPFAARKEEEWLVSNAFWIQAIANYFRAEVVAGLDDRDGERRENYNAAFHFTPDAERVDRYEKRVLLPLAEYLPFRWMERLTRSYGITEFFTPGKGAKVFRGRVPLAVSICYEETFGEVVREGRMQGAELLVNVTNDSWYPHSKLPQQHFDHAKLRAVENGAPLVRACNTGVTAAVDSLGRTLAAVGEDRRSVEWSAEALTVELPTYHYRTPYLLWGNGGILILSLLILIAKLFCACSKYLRSANFS